MLIDVADLAGTDWSEGGTSSWIAGLGEKGPMADRTRKTGEYVAHRHFLNEESDLRVDVQVRPAASVADAETVVLNAVSQETTTLRKRVIETLVINDLKVPGAESLVAWDNLTECDGLSGHSRKVEGRVDRLVFWVQCSGVGSGPGWDVVTEIASTQAAKLRSFRASDSEQ
jgi:hypothetical protein